MNAEVLSETKRRLLDRYFREGAGASAGDRKGEAVRIDASSDANLIVLSGEPFDEPIVGYGPFVMNTQDEIRRAITDYQSGRMGHLGS